jgi:hypothetical protein
MRLKFSIPEQVYYKIAYKGETKSLRLEQYGDSADIDDYEHDEIVEMCHGIYRRKKYLRDDEGTYLHLENVVRATCTLVAVTYKNQYISMGMSKHDLNRLSNIKSFFVSEYALIAKDASTVKETKHVITNYLYKSGEIRKAAKKYKGLFLIRNDYENFAPIANGKCPRDLFHPIKNAINYLFFNDGYYINQFVVEGALKIF